MLADNATYAFNDYLEITSETGIIGLILFLSITFYSLYLYLISYRSTKSKLAISIGLSGIIGILVSAIFSYPLANLPTYLMFLTYLAIISSFDTTRINKFSLKPFYLRMFLFFLIVFNLFVIRLQLNRLISQIQWRNATNKINHESSLMAFQTLDKLYPSLKYDGLVLYNYGTLLSLYGKYEKSLSILKECEISVNDADFYTYLGNTLEGLENFNEAGQAYLQATYIIPHKLYPHYRLAYLYIKMNRINDAQRKAEEVISMTPKIVSSNTELMKSDMKSLLDEINENQLSQ